MGLAETSRRGSAGMLVAAAFFCGAAFSGARAATLPSPCSASQLSAADTGTTAVGARRVTKIELINDSSRTCTLEGYPQLSLTRFSGTAPFLFLSDMTIAAGYHTPQARPIVLRSLQHASFLLGYPRTAAEALGCTPTSNISIAFGRYPHFGVVTLPDVITPCGRLDVSPFFVGSLATARSLR